MQLETRTPGYWLVHNVVPPKGLQIPIADCEHPLLCLPGTGIASRETAISGSFQQNLAGVYNGVTVWRLIMGWIPRYGDKEVLNGGMI